MIRAVIIEDEKQSQDLLMVMLEKYCTNVQVEGVASSVESGIKIIKEQKPDLVFLDVELSDGNGFDVLSAFEKPTFRVVFVTGFDHYAIKAIKFSALDYLLKPVSLEELRNAIKKLETVPTSYIDNFEHLKNNLNTRIADINKIVLSGNKSYKVLKIEDIIFVEAERTYVTFHLINSQKIVAANPLNFYEDVLPESKFFRIHKSYIINCTKINKIEPGRGGPVHLEGGAILPIAFRRKPTFIQFLEKIA